ncbi:MAG: hypothetical protein Q4B01_02425 [Eubacteriales bacterium]|nr:hypothetical protein [Eubacteriales bacterium]
MKKHRSFKGTSLAMLLLMICLGSSLSVHAASTDGWAKAYLKVLKRENRTLKRDNAQYTSSDISAVNKYELIYFNEDEIPELLVCRQSYWVSLYTYDPEAGKVVKLMNQWGYGAGGNAGYAYLPRKNALFYENSDYAGALVWVNHMKMRDNRLVYSYSKPLTIRYYVDSNNNGFPDPEELISKPRYYRGEKKISKKRFMKYKIGSDDDYVWMAGKDTFAKMKRRLKKYGA